MTAPSEDGDGGRRVMEMAIKKAGIRPSEVDYINAHATSTNIGDAVESKAIRALFKNRADKIAISATKSLVGHALGAAGHRKTSQLLDQLLRDQQPQPRLAAARALGKLGGRDVVPILKKGLEDSDQAVRIAAASSLVKAVAAAKK